MVIPPFPSQDLAKLVLGYLAEEQLMTAYDEFLQASPYLDALRNEYDRIFMTSLKNILAEYRAVKIYVETCKPFVLRKKLLQCSNLLEIVKFLVQNTDINKLNAQDVNIDKTSFNFSFSKNTLVTSSNTMQPNLYSMNQIETTALESSVETTSLEDLPGNVTTTKKSVKVLDRETKKCSNFELNNEAGYGCPVSPSSIKSVNMTPSNDKGLALHQQTLKTNYSHRSPNSEKPESEKKIEEFNNILDFVCKNGSTIQNTSSDVDSITNRQESVTAIETFQDFSSDSEKNNVPDCNTSLSNKAQAPFKKSLSNRFVNIGAINATDLKNKSHIILTVDGSQGNLGIPAKTTATPILKQNYINPKLDKCEKQKIKILSDVKVDNLYENLPAKSKMPPILNNTTSTPFQMQTILINGTPAYKNKTQCAPNYNFTKDEIMAMPTIILVPATENASNQTDSEIAMPKTADTVCTSSAQNLLKPLLIDVSSNTCDPNLNYGKDPTIIQNKQTVVGEQSLVKTIEVSEQVSLLKDNTLTTLAKTSTPQGIPPKRKSSSTPRRTSHIRFLKFTTPRKILHETINEQSSNNDCLGNINHRESVQTVSNESQIEVTNTNVATEKLSCIVSVDCKNIHSGPTKENKIVPIKKSNWDADLRALAVSVTDVESSRKPPQKTRDKSKISKKKNDVGNLSNEKREERTKKKKKTLLKEKTKNEETRDNNEVEETTHKSDQKVPAAVKPNINIITGNDWSLTQENDKNQSKGNKSDDQIDTPESDRVALQNVIGAKLNISDLLETPYKQALYDIQMETPKFLGADLPDEPISDVKIMNIPTPRFLCSPKGPQATPSSYSSRPTDYSSGGSYYKPDDQDYIISTEVLENPVATEAENINVKNNNDQPKEQETFIDNKIKEGKSGRPIRQCRKNVSYFTNPNTSCKIKENSENSEQNDTASLTTKPCDKKTESQDDSKHSKDYTKSKRKLDSNKKSSSLKKTKSPLKRETLKSFPKIKPRRTTPTKELIGRKNRKISESHNKQQKRTNSKDRSTNLTPIATAIPTKSRRKSSTPRKLNCTKTFNLESSCHKSPEISKIKQDLLQESQVSSHESDIEQLPLHWSDDGSRDGKPVENKIQTETVSVNDSEDITKIKEYIETSGTEKSNRTKDCEKSFHINLINRGFDVETAKIIERDLLDSPSSKFNTYAYVPPLEHPGCKVIETKTITENLLSNSNLVNNGDDDSEEIELSIYECNEDTVNYISHQHDDSYPVLQSEPAKLRDNFSMEICVDDGVTIRLRATMFNLLLDQDPQEKDAYNFCKETEIAVSSITNIDKLYTPMKDPKRQVYEIFDSTLTSLDTPLKENFSKSVECAPSVTEIALEEENVEIKEKTDFKRRKRVQSGCLDESANCSKRAKPDAQYLLKTANIQNFDIESVLSKLHGP
ncbi:inner centromere protein A-like isoform X2 [Battus philenor]|uniref:inner centromere protein A-like isoform X2 n=1 Tax=Battus philenor TaxID=42288 RepID=UPI0035CF0970